MARSYCEPTHPLRSISITEISSLLLDDPPPCSALVLRPLWGLHLGFSLNIGTTGSQVPRRSQVQSHAISMPDAAQTVSRCPLRLSWNPESTPVLTSSYEFRHLIEWFAFAHLSEPYLPRSYAVTFPKRSPPRLFTDAALGGLKPAPACRLRGTYPHLLCSYAHYVKQCALGTLSGLTIYQSLSHIQVGLVNVMATVFLTAYTISDCYRLFPGRSWAGLPSIRTRGCRNPSSVASESPMPAHSKTPVHPW